MFEAKGCRWHAFGEFLSEPVFNYRYATAGLLPVGFFGSFLPTQKGTRASKPKAATKLELNCFSKKQYSSLI
ncbi:MAG TPA: hypothetical protein VK963_04775 [Candidatus Saccharimonadales bacterium]|nr:hypothetical protein [Candidatus Saccharimonadales bacterium]